MEATSSAEGALVGGIIYVGGAPPGFTVANGYQPGVVEVLRADEVVARQRVEAGHGYEFRLPPGDYVLRVQMGERSATSAATVRAAKTVKSDVICNLR